MKPRWAYDAARGRPRPKVRLQVLEDEGIDAVNPFGLTWDELRASDVMRMDADGKELDGPWTITPAITLQVEHEGDRAWTGTVESRW
jgi:hypothetical protein